MKKRMLSLALALSLLFSPAVPAAAVDKYEGILPGAWYEAAARFAVDEGLMTGTGRGFAPDEPLTRAQVVQALYNGAGRPGTADWPIQRGDVEGKWYQDAVVWADVMGMLRFSPDGLFRGEEAITRAETAFYLVGYAYEVMNLYWDATSQDLAGVPDAGDIPEEYYSVMALSRAAGILKGDGQGNLRPNETLARAQLAQMLYNLYRWTPPPVKPDQEVFTVPGREGAETIKVAVVKNGYMDAAPDLWREVCAAFAAQTGYGVELTASRALDALLGKQMKEGQYPDVAYLATGREAGLVERLIEEHALADLTDVLGMTVPGESKKVSEKLLPGFAETGLTNPYGDGKTYLAPVFYGPCGLFYNADLFAQKGWKLPETWDEMWTLADRAKKEGISLFTWPTTGYLDMVLYALLYEAGGPALFERAARYEKGIWDTPEAKKCMDVMARLAAYAHPLTPAQANDQDFQMNQQLVLDNKALFMPNGSWIINEMADRPRADGFAWGVMPLPTFAGRARYSLSWAEQCWIPTAAEHVETAKEFVAFLYSDKACEIFARAGAVQPVKGLSQRLDGDNRLVYSVYEKGAKPAIGNFSDVTAPVYFTTVREIFFDPMNSLAAGFITKERWLEQIKSASDQFRANLE